MQQRLRFGQLDFRVEDTVCGRLLGSGQDCLVCRLSNVPD